MRIRVVPPPPTRLRITRRSRFWSAHTHSVYSSQDALPQVSALVEKASQLGQRALGLTDHGNMAGSVELYKACTKAGIKPFPGLEAYLVPSTELYKADYKSRTTKAQRFHLGVLAVNETGYRHLVELNTAAHKNHFHKPLIDFAMLSEFAEQGKTEGLAVTTGCFFGYLIQQLYHRGEDNARHWLYTLNSWFPERTFVEIQNHFITHEDGTTDDQVADRLVEMADQVGFPVVITQDSHYVEPHDKEEHEALKRLVAFGPDADDAVFPGDGFHLATENWIRDHHTGYRLDRGLDGLDHLFGLGELRIPVLDTYSYSVPLTVPDPEAVLRERCERELEQRGLPRRYRDRLAEELEVVAASRMGGYLLLVADVAEYMKSTRILFHTRGSAAGSLICWLLGITTVDPVKWGLMFERFLSKDRTKPPDIDLDIAHDRRQDLIDWLGTRFSVHQIGTWMEMGLTKEEAGEDADSKGSLLVKYYSSQRKQQTGFYTWEQVPEHDRDMLHRLANHRPFSGIGTNAAGLVITSTKKQFNDLVPLMHMSDPKHPDKRRLVSQYDLKGIEDLGLVKLDVLGSKTLTVLRKAMALLGRDDLDWIPLTDRQTFNFIKTGQTAGIFQLEGGASARGVRDLQPSSIKDVIAAMALFRPATMQSGATKAYINRKHGREQAPARHEIIERHTKATHGILLYQEQVIAVLRDLGMGADDLTSFLKAIKASNANIGNAAQVIADLMDEVHSLCRKVGMSEADMEWLNEAFEAYSGYGFNSAHATVYGIAAYRCAYLAVHHPLEFHTALLDVAAGNKDKEPRYQKAVIARGHRILKADINASGLSYTLDTRRKAIRRGLLSVKGIGIKTAEEIVRCQPYTDVKDLCERVDHRKVTGVKGYRDTGDLDQANGHLAALRDGGTLDSII